MDPKRVKTILLARGDTVLREYLAEQARREERLEQLRGRYGDAHPEVVDVKQGIARAAANVDRYLAEMAEVVAASATLNATPLPSSPAGVADPGLGAGGPLANRPPELLRQDEQRVGVLLAEAQQEMAALGNKRLVLTRLNSAAEETRRDLGTTSQRLASLKIEEAVGGRMQVLNPGDVPVAPFKDDTEKLGAAGLLFGMLVPFGLVLLWGSMNPKYRYADEAQDHNAANVRLLGIIPALRDDLGDPAQAAAAAQCVHQLRVMLQVGSQRGQRQSYMVTSSSPGEGKTNLTLSLAMSFAASGSRTLVVDCDVVGQRLTRSLGFQDRIGLREALLTSSLEKTISRTPFPRLCALPIGQATATEGYGMSPHTMQSLLGQLHRFFDLIIIDTGPVMGSIETSIVAPLVDEVLMVVARGQRQPLVERSINHLRSVGGKLAGVVFNRANARDFNRAASSGASVQSASVHTKPTTVPVDLGALRAGPLVRAVAMFLPSRAESRPERLIGTSAPAAPEAAEAGPAAGTRRP
jgi:capsular exopolysaccharide synthesis family protein